MSNKNETSAAAVTAIDELDRVIEREAYPEEEGLCEAREAFAELIEAASDYVNGGAIGVVARKQRLLAALDRVGGEA